MSTKAQQAAKAMSSRAKSKKGSGELRKNIMIGVGVVVSLAAIYLAATDPGSGKKRAQSSGGRGSKANAYVNDRYFVSDVTSYAAGNFTAAASPFFNYWTYADVTYGLDGVSVKGEGMIGFAGALSRCPEVDESLETGAVPPSYDLREQAPSCTGGEVYDQGNCSSSYAIAAATSLGSRFCFSDQEKYGGTRLSPQQVLSCDKKSDGCKGGGIDAVWSYIERRGLFPESCVPFAGGKEAACKSECAPEQKLKAIEHCLMSGAKAIKREIYNRGPVVAAMYLKDDFMVYKGGVYTPTDNANMQFGADGQPIQHAVTIMGWGRFEGTPYWIVKNSWSTTWGEDGWARVAISSGAVREEAVIVGKAATPEAIAAEEKRKEEEAIRKEQLKKERAERDARIREREAQRAAEEAERRAAEERFLLLMCYDSNSREAPSVSVLSVIALVCMFANGCLWWNCAKIVKDIPEKPSTWEAFGVLERMGRSKSIRLAAHHTLAVEAELASVATAWAGRGRGASWLSPPSTCVVCLENFTPEDMLAQLPCGHVFHPTCVRQWLRDASRARQCPFRCMVIPGRMATAGRQRETAWA